MKISLSVLGICFLLGSISLQAREIFVNPQIGSDSADGLSATPANGHGPVKTIKAGITLAGPGDTVQLDPAGSPYSEQVLFSDKSGTAEAPIVLEGNGSIIEGSVPIVAAEWEDQENGLYKSTIIPAVHCYDANPAYVGRFFFLMGEKMNRMGRSAKGSATPYKTLVELAPGEWTYVESEKAFYLRIAAGTKLEESGIRVPKMVSGIQITGNCHHLTIRNITATHVINDGFALTVGQDKNSTVRNIRFENITARDCGDDGLSAHGDCEVFVDGFLSTGNSTGYCSQGVSVNRRVRTENIDGMDIYPIGGRHEFIDCAVNSTALRPVVVTPVPPAVTVELVLNNCLIVNASGRPPANSAVRIDKGGSLIARRLTTQGLAFFLADGATAKLEDSLIMGGPEAFVQCATGARWQGTNNVYDLGYFRLGDERIAARDLPNFLERIGESESVFQSVDTISVDKMPANIPAGVGADHSALRRN